MTSRFPNRYLRAVDNELLTIDRLRLKTPTWGAARPGGGTADRSRSIPQMLWPDWTSLLLPAAGFNPELLRVGLSSALLVPGGESRNLSGLAQRLNPRVTSAHLSVLLQGMSKLPTSFTDILTLICRIADHLDIHGAPIDYRHRREHLPTETIT